MKNESPVINYSPSCRSKPVRPLFIFGTESRLTSVDLNSKNSVFRGLNKILSDVYSCSYRALSKYEKTIGSRVWTEAIQWSVTTH